MILILEAVHPEDLDTSTAAPFLLGITLQTKNNNYHRFNKPISIIRMRVSVLAVVAALALPSLAVPNANPEPATFDDPHTLFPRYSCSVFSDYCPQDCLAGRKDRDCSASYVCPPLSAVPTVLIRSIRELTSRMGTIVVQGKRL